MVPLELSRGSDLIKVIFIVVIAAINVANVRPEQVVESCLGNFITQDLKDDWVNADKVTNATFYFPLTTKHHVRLLAKNLYQTQDFEKINDGHLQKSCLSMRKLTTWASTNITGYNGKHFILSMAPTNLARLFRFTLAFPDVVTGSGYASIALSDSKSYDVFDFCYDNGLRTFVVASTKQSLDQNTLDVIKAHVKSIGFLEKNFVTINYKECSTKNGLLRTTGDDLPQPSELRSVFLYRPVAKKYILPSYIVKG